MNYFSFAQNIDMLTLNLESMKSMMKQNITEIIETQQSTFSFRKSN